MKKVSVILLCFLCLVFSAQATDYYFSTSGSDANSGTNSGSPYQTFGKVNQILTSAKGGDRLLFKRGDVFNGAFTPTVSGTSAAPIILGAYGTGSKPVISGFITVSGWTLIDAAKGIYESSALTTGSTLNMVVINGVEYARGRYPNMDNGNDGYAMYESHTSNSITDNESTIDATWQGATIAIRTTRSNIDMDTITNVSNKTITFNTAHIANPITTNNYGYFLQDDIKTLDQFGEWYYDQSTKKIDVCFGNNNPSLFTIQVSAFDKLLRPINNFTIRDLTFTGANTYAIHNDWTATSNINIINCSFTFSGIDAICLANKTNVLIDSCTFDYSNSNAISVGDEDVNITISHCTITNTALFQGMLIKDDRNRYGHGIFSDSPLTYTGLTCTNNVINKTGFCAIFFSGDNNLVQYNFVDSSCMILDDGAGIYTYNYARNLPVPHVNVNNKIVNNIVLHSLAAPKGSARIQDTMSHAIYCDDNSVNVDIMYNTAAFCAKSGVFIHNGNNINVQNNVLYNNGQTQVYMSDDDLGGYVLNNDIQSNYLFSTRPSAYNYWMESTDNNFANWGRIDNNTIVSLFNPVIAFRNWFGQGSQAEKFYTLSQFSSTLNYENNSKPVAVTIPNTGSVFFQYNATNAPVKVSLDGTYVELDHTIHNSGSIVIQPFSSVLLIKTSSTVPKKKKYNKFKGNFGIIRLIQ